MLKVDFNTGKPPPKVTNRMVMKCCCHLMNYLLQLTNYFFPNKIIYISDVKYMGQRSNSNHVDKKLSNFQVFDGRTAMKHFPFLSLGLKGRWFLPHYQVSHALTLKKTAFSYSSFWCCTISSNS